MFRVFVGDETRKPRLIDEDEVVATDDGHLVVAVPVEYQRTFENDLIKAIRDIAGYSTQALHPFILDTDAVARVLRRRASRSARARTSTSRRRRSICCPKRIQQPAGAALHPYRLGEVEGQRRPRLRPRRRLQAHGSRRLSGDAADHPARHDPGGSPAARRRDRVREAAHASSTCCATR